MAVNLGKFLETNIYNQRFQIINHTSLSKTRYGGRCCVLSYLEDKKNGVCRFKPGGKPFYVPVDELFFTAPLEQARRIVHPQEVNEVQENNETGDAVNENVPVSNAETWQVHVNNNDSCQGAVPAEQEITTDLNVTIPGSKNTTSISDYATPELNFSRPGSVSTLLRSTYAKSRAVQVTPVLCKGSTGSHSEDGIIKRPRFSNVLKRKMLRIIDLSSDSEDDIATLPKRSPKWQTNRMQQLKNQIDLNPFVRLNRIPEEEVRNICEKRKGKKRIQNTEARNLYEINDFRETESYFSFTLSRDRSPEGSHYQVTKSPMPNLNKDNPKSRLRIGYDDKIFLTKAGRNILCMITKITRYCPICMWGIGKLDNSIVMHNRCFHIQYIE